MTRITRPVTAGLLALAMGLVGLVGTAPPARADHSVDFQVYCNAYNNQIRLYPADIAPVVGGTADWVTWAVGLWDRDRQEWLFPYQSGQSDIWWHDYVHLSEVLDWSSLVTVLWARPQVVLPDARYDPYILVAWWYNGAWNHSAWYLIEDLPGEPRIWNQDDHGFYPARTFPQHYDGSCDLEPAYNRFGIPYDDLCAPGSPTPVHWEGGPTPSPFKRR